MGYEFNEAPQTGLVSIIIPCFNAERFLAKTLESAFAQTYSLSEVIVVDDGSTDGTPALIRSYGNRVKASFGSNRGASAARNRGTALARGEFIQYLDSDDLLMPDSLAHRVAALQAAAADVAYSDWEELVEIQGGVFKIGKQFTRRSEDIDADLIAALITSFWAPPAALTYRRTIVEKIGGWKEWLPIIQDARFLQDAALVGGKFIHVPVTGAQYRLHQGESLSRRSSAAFVFDVFRNGSDLQEILEGRGMLSAAQRHALAKVYDYAARSLFFQNKRAFNDCVARLYQVEPKFRLSWPKAARLSSAIVGFQATGALLFVASGLRRILTSSRQ
jgi:glycosyltransferase involved in cell wall biosynthesis